MLLEPGQFQINEYFNTQERPGKIVRVLPLLDFEHHVTCVETLLADAVRLQITCYRCIRLEELYKEKKRFLRFSAY